MQEQAVIRHEESPEAVVVTATLDEYTAAHEGKEYKAEGIHVVDTFDWDFLTKCATCYSFENEGTNLVLVHTKSGRRLVFQYDPPSIDLVHYEEEIPQQQQQQSIKSLSEKIDSLLSLVESQQLQIEQLKKENISMQRYKNLAIGCRVYGCNLDGTVAKELTSGEYNGFDDVFSRGVECLFDTRAHTDHASVMVELSDLYWINTIDVSASYLHHNKSIVRIDVSESLSGPFICVFHGLDQTTYSAHFQALNVQYIRLKCVVGNGQSVFGKFSVRFEP